MVKKKSEFVDLKKYCNHLTKPPKVGVNYVDPTGFYLCRFNKEGCIAREIKHSDTSYYMWDFYGLSINQEALLNCDLHNIPEENAKEIMNLKIREKILIQKAKLSKLEGELS